MYVLLSDDLFGTVFICREVDNNKFGISNMIWSVSDWVVVGLNDRAEGGRGKGRWQGWGVSGRWLWFRSYVGKRGRQRRRIWFRVMGGFHHDGSVDVSMDQSQKDTIEEIFCVKRDELLSPLDFYEVVYQIHVGLVIMSDREVFPVDYCIGETAEVILEFRETKPEGRFEDVVDVDIGLFRVHRAGRRSRHEGNE